MGNIIQAQLLFLESVDAKKDIKIFLNSPGGSCSCLFQILDTMLIIKPEIEIINTAMAASAAAVLLCSGAKGKRKALKHARTMIHQISGGGQGTSSDMEIMLKEMLKYKEELYTIIAENTGQTYEKVQKDADRDYWMTANEAKEYGMIDVVLDKKK